MDPAAQSDDSIETTIRGEARRIGKFALLETIGKGSSGTVYKALDTFSGQEVALKVLDQSLFEGERISATIRGTRVMWAPESRLMPRTSTSSWTAAATTSSGVRWRPV